MSLALERQQVSRWERLIREFNFSISCEMCSGKIRNNLHNNYIPKIPPKYFLSIIPKPKGNVVYRLAEITCFCCTLYPGHLQKFLYTVYL